jgi:LEA14-like dessication related protein
MKHWIRRLIGYPLYKDFDMSQIARLGWLLVLALGVGGCASLAPPPDLKAPEVSLNDLSIEKFDLAQMQFALKVDMKNPNAVAMPLSNLKLDLQLVGLAVATARSTQPSFNLPANGSATVPITLEVPFSKIGESIRQLRLNSTSDQLYQLKGTVAWGPLGLPLSFERKGSAKDLLAKFLPQAR